MTKLNLNYHKLTGKYLFSEIEKRLDALKGKHPAPSFLNLGVGDATLPLFPCVTEALTSAIQEMGIKETFRGYGPSQGYSFLRKKIAETDYRDISPDEIFISDGAASDLADLQEIFSPDNRVAVIDPGYPAYVDVNVMAGRTRPLLKTGRFGGITYLHCKEEHQFQPQIPEAHVDLIYLCSPNNPTGIGLTRGTLSRFVEYAKANNSVIIFDGAYEAFVTSQEVPRSIYEIAGAKEVAIEVRSFSKSAGFTGLRCSYTVVPHALKIRDAGGIHPLHPLWARRVDTKTNGVSYPVQRGAEALFTEEGQKAIAKAIGQYQERAKKLLFGLKSIGYTVYGGVDSPYLWCKTPPKISSWAFFDFLLENAHIVAIPGSGFGPGGEGFIRFSAFANLEVIDETLVRFQKLA